MAFLRCPATSTTALNIGLFPVAETSCLVKSFRASGCFEGSSMKAAALERPCVHPGCLWGAGVLTLLPEPPLSPGEDSDCCRGQGLEPQLLGTSIGPCGTWVLFHSSHVQLWQPPRCLARRIRTRGSWLPGAGGEHGLSLLLVRAASLPARSFPFQCWPLRFYGWVPLSGLKVNSKCSP